MFFMANYHAELRSAPAWTCSWISSLLPTSKFFWILNSKLEWDSRTRPHGSAKRPTWKIVTGRGRTEKSSPRTSHTGEEMAIKREIFLIYYFKNTSRAYKKSLPVNIHLIFFASRSINSSNYNLCLAGAGQSFVCVFCSLHWRRVAVARRQQQQ